MLAEGVDLLKQPADLRIGVIYESRVDLLQPRGQPLFVGIEFVPDLHSRIAGAQPLIGRQQAGSLLARQGSLPGRVPAAVESALVLVRVVGRHMAGRVAGGECDVEEEGLVRIGGHQLPQPLAGLIDDVFRQVIALPPRRLDALVAHDQFRIPLVRLAREKAVEAVETPL